MNFEHSVLSTAEQLFVVFKDKNDSISDISKLLDFLKIDSELNGPVGPVLKRMLEGLFEANMKTTGPLSKERFSAMFLNFVKKVAPMQGGVEVLQNIHSKIYRGIGHLFDLKDADGYTYEFEDVKKNNEFALNNMSSGGKKYKNKKTKKIKNKNKKTKKVKSKKTKSKK